jgi:acetyl-CoA C-acetyltransferase
VIDPRAPVVVGVGQVNQHATPEEARPPLDLLAEATRTADADTHAKQSLLQRVDIVAIVAIGSWRYADPGAFLARELKIEPRATAITTVGGNSPQLLVNEFAPRIQAGECDVVLIGGGESMNARLRARKEPRIHLEWPSGDDADCSWVIGDTQPGSNAYEAQHLAIPPTMVYPLFETALRAEFGRAIDEHQKHVSEIWAGFSEVAARNPHSWSQESYSAEEIRSVSTDNRLVCFPYPKRMCANIDVDQAAAFILCSYEAAESAGVPDDRIVFLHAGVDAHDHHFVTERDTLTTSPAIRFATRAALEATGVGIDDVAHIDLYSCFPSAVQIAARELEVDPLTRPLTVTGGLGFAGGPVNNYPSHSIATMVDVLRGDPGAYGLTTALGWYVSKHSVGVWSTTPPARPLAQLDVQSQVDARPKREPAGLIAGDAKVEATAVSFERDGTPAVGIVSAITEYGHRALANTRDTDVLADMTVDAWEGRRVQFTNDGSTNTLAI